MLQNKDEVGVPNSGDGTERRLALLEAAVATYQRQDQRHRALGKLRQAADQVSEESEVQAFLAQVPVLIEQGGSEGDWVVFALEEGTPRRAHLRRPRLGTGWERVRDKQLVDALFAAKANKADDYWPEVGKTDVWRVLGGGIRSIFFAPFSRWVFALYSDRPKAFGQKDFALVREVGQIVGQGFIRLELEGQLARHRRYFQQAPTAYFTLNGDDQVCQANQQAARELEYGIEDLVGRQLVDLCADTPAGKLRCRNLLRSFRSGDANSEDVIEMCTSSGGTYWKRLLLKSVEESGQNTGELLAIAVDMTAQKQLEDQLRHAQKMEAIGQLTAGIAHNFNNMLQGIISNIQMALFGAPDEMRPLLKEAEDAAGRTAEMIRQLMHFASRKGVVPFQLVDLRAAVENAVAICRKTFDRDIDIEIEWSGEVLLVRGEASQLEQVVLNLCLNARDALEEGSGDQALIHIAVESLGADQVDRRGHPEAIAGPYVRLEISDNGVGMAAEVKRHLFEPFFTTKEVGKGTGLGLATVFAIVRDHHGWIECGSQPGRGTTFSLYFPAVSPLGGSTGETKRW